MLACCVNVAQIPSEYAGSAPEGVTFKFHAGKPRLFAQQEDKAPEIVGRAGKGASDGCEFFSTTVSAAGTKWELCIPDRLTISCSEVTMSGRVSGVGRVWSLREGAGFPRAGH
ncbi:MAG: hypothetical protein ACLSTO_02985 [Bilophila wadsworthia]